MGYIRDELDDAFGKRIGKALWIILALIVLYVVIALIGGIWPFSVVKGVVTKVTDPTVIIQNYEWFYDQYHSIAATEHRVAIAKQTLDATDKTADDYSRRVTEYAGVQMVLAGMIEEYNARSRQITRNLWKANDLPYQIGE